MGEVLVRLQNTLYFKKKTLGIETIPLKSLIGTDPNSLSKEINRSSLLEILGDLQIHIIHAGPSIGIYHSKNGGHKYGFKNQIKNSKSYSIKWDLFLKEIYTFYNEELKTFQHNDFWENF